MAGNKNSGRKKGEIYPKKEKIRPKVKIKSIKINPYEHIGKQLRPYRLYFKYTYQEMQELTGVSHTNIAHFENQDQNYVGKRRPETRIQRGTGWGETAIKYVKALGIKEVIFIL